MHTLEDSLVFPKQYIDKDSAEWKYSTADDNLESVMVPFREPIQISFIPKKESIIDTEADLNMVRGVVNIRTTSEMVRKLLELESDTTKEHTVIKYTCSGNKYYELLAIISEIAACMFCTPKVMKNVEAAAKLGLVLEPVLTGDMTLINKIKDSFTGTPYRLEPSIDLRLRCKLYIVLNTFDVDGNIVPSQFGFGQLLYSDLEVDHVDTKHTLFNPRYLCNVSTKALGVVEVT